MSYIWLERLKLLYDYIQFPYGRRKSQTSHSGEEKKVDPFGGIEFEYIVPLVFLPAFFFLTLPLDSLVNSILFIVSEAIYKR